MYGLTHFLLGEKIYIQRGRREEMEQETGTKKSRKKLIIGLVIAALAVITLIILLYNYNKTAEYFKTHFFSGSVMNGTDISEMTSEEAGGTIQDYLSGYIFTFTDHEGRESVISADEIDLKYDDNGEIAEILGNQDSNGWIFNNGKDASYTVRTGYVYNKEKLQDWINALPCLNDGTPSRDAYEVEKATGYWGIIPETYGDEIYADKLSKMIISAVDNYEPSLAIDYDKEKELFIPPEIIKSDETLTSDVKAKNDALDAYYEEKRREARIEEITDLNLKFNSYIDKVYINKDLLMTMITDDERGNPVIDEKKFKQWVRDWAEERGFTTNPNLFVTHGGRLMQVNNGPFRGWMMDLEATAEKAYKAVINGDKGVIHPVLVDSEGNLQTKQTYVEINIMKQTMWLYVDGKEIVETPVVTGNVSRGMSTPSNGVWHIDRMNRYYTMVGADYVAYCDYWMAFNGGIGIHDLASRDAFGGDIYLTGGSHGCVNTPYEAVSVIYNNVSLGTPVVVHS